jgi:hypothetical protein
VATDEKLRRNVHLVTFLGALCAGVSETLNLKPFYNGSTEVLAFGRSPTGFTGGYAPGWPDRRLKKGGRGQVIRVQIIEPELDECEDRRTWLGHMIRNQDPAGHGSALH